MNIRSGMTLIEIMIVVAIIAAMMTLATVGVGGLLRADVQGEALRMSSAIRYTFNMAATTNVTLQMKLDFNERTFAVEQLDVAGGLSDDELRGTSMKTAKSRNPYRNSKADALDAEDTKFGVVTRTPVDGMFISGEDAQLKEGVYIIGLMTSHHDEIQTDDVGTINFFSNGFVERSVIFLGDEVAKDTGMEEGAVYTISVNPLTGQSSVQPGKMEISSTFFEEEEDD